MKHTTHAVGRRGQSGDDETLKKSQRDDHTSVSVCIPVTAAPALDPPPPPSAERTHTMSPPAAVDVVAAVDQGTQSTRVFLYAAADLAVVASHQVELTQHYPQPG